MRVVVTRPPGDAERTANVLRSHGYEVLVAPLMRIEPIPADLSGRWSAVVITSTNAPGAISRNRLRAALLKLPVFAVGKRSAASATAAGFVYVDSADGDVRDLVRLIAERHAATVTPLLYLAGEDRSTDLIGEFAARDIKAEMRVVYRAVTMQFSPELVEALTAGDVDAVLHFSKRSAEIYLAGATAAGLGAQALGVRHLCLSEQIAKPLQAAGATQIAVAARPDEAALIELLSILSD